MEQRHARRGLLFCVLRALSGGKRNALIARPAIVHGLAACLLIMLLGACATTATSAPPASSTPATSAESSGAVTLVLWHGWSGDGRMALGRLIDRFNRQHPSGQIILQEVPLATFDSSLRSQIASGSGPHLILIPNSWVGSLAEANALLPLDELISPSEQQPLLPAALGGARARGHDGD
jgi:ABC-type glycerol-3-phosphate transport system substrate-binding protein